MRPYAGRRIVLGVTGGIASYKTGWLARLLTAAGAEVDVVMTRAATEFVGPVTFEALTARPVHTDLFEAGRALDHIALAKAADAIVVAPATADFLARVAHGFADDLLTACLLATEAPVLLVPAMNDRMWANRQTQENVRHLRELGHHVVEPDEGPLAAGEGSGPGRMPEPETIMAYVGRVLETDGAFRGRHILVTAGPTREPVDPVRFLSNRSSGKMGVAIAAAAWRRGAEVALVAGPLETPIPPGICLTTVETTQDMADAVRAELPTADALVMAAAPADFGVAEPSRKKIKKKDNPETIVLAPTPDILRATRDARKPNAVIVGFALETGDAIAGGREKLATKDLDLVIVNDAEDPAAGFGVDTNRVTIVHRDGRTEELGVLPKTDVADAILDRVEALLRER